MELTADQAILQAVEGLPTAGPSSTPAHGPARRNYHKKHKVKQVRDNGVAC